MIIETTITIPRFDVLPLVQSLAHTIMPTIPNWNWSEQIDFLNSSVYTQYIIQYAHKK